MEKQQAEPYAGVAVPVNEMQPVAPVPYTGAPLAPVQAVAQESLPLPTMQAFRGARSGSVMHIQLADGRILEVAVPPGTPPGHQIHFPVAAAPPPGVGCLAARAAMNASTVIDGVVVSAGILVGTRPNADGAEEEVRNDSLWGEITRAK